jgi:hypothetical protein
MSSEPTPSGEGTFNIIDNLHVYYQVKDPEFLFNAFKGYFREQIALPSDKKTLIERDNLIYFMGLVLRSSPADLVVPFFKSYLDFFLPPVTYGALWYSNVDSAWEILVDIAQTHKNPKNAKLAQAFVDLGRPVEGRPNLLPTQIRRSKTPVIAYIEELFAYWMVYGTRESVESMLRHVDVQSAKRCVGICEHKNGEEISAYYKTLSKDAAKYDQAMLIGAMSFDTILLNTVKSILFGEKSSK